MKGKYITAFFDILGTKYKVKTGTFTDYESLDFSNTACLMAKKFPSINVSIFSDSIIVFCKKAHLNDLLDTIAFLYQSWFSDLILVRGGVAYGELIHITSPELDDNFKDLKNLSLTRIYGKSLVDAVLTEKKSGPGAMCFMHSSMHSIIPEHYRGQGPVEFIDWLTPQENKWIFEYCENMLEQSQNSKEKKHLKATLYLFKNNLKS